MGWDRRGHLLQMMPLEGIGGGLPLLGHLSLWLWGVLGSPSPSGPSACCPEPWFCQSPQGGYPGPLAGVGKWACSAAASR